MNISRLDKSNVICVSHARIPKKIARDKRLCFKKSENMCEDPAWQQSIT